MTDAEPNISQLHPGETFKFCRICGEESEQGQTLFHCNQEIQKLAVKICSYIKIKLRYVRIYPNWICPGCKLQFESSDQFFELIRNGQKALTHKFGTQVNKRGRKPKGKCNQPTLEIIRASSDDKDTTTEDAQKRSTKTPGRLQDSMQGNELEILYSEMGVTKKRGKPNKKTKTKLIAHIEDRDGATLGEMLAIPQNPQKTTTRYQCDICKEEFIHDGAFFKHVATHRNILYECTECVNSFPTKTLLDSHQLTENHKGMGIIEMPFIDIGACNKEEAIADDIHAEKDSQADVEQPTLKEPTKFVCTKCSKSFATKRSMKRHQVIHSPNRPHKCDICLAAFKLKSTLQIHKRSHTGERAFKCHRCPKTFIHRQTLKAHLRSHDGLKPYLCSICKTSFYQLGALQEHKRIHTGERPYVCLICGTSFKTSSQCRVHQRQHTHPTERISKPFDYENVQKTHSCKRCGKLFSHRSAMVKHFRTHTGEKPYICHLCGRCFSDPSNYKKHHLRHAIPNSRNKIRKIRTKKQNSTQMPSKSNPNPEIVPSTNSLLLERVSNRNNALMDILDDDDDRHSKAWGLLRSSSDPVITEIHNDRFVTDEQKQPGANQLVCISYQDPMNPVTNKKTFYVVN